MKSSTRNVLARFSAIICSVLLSQYLGACDSVGGTRFVSPADAIAGASPVDGTVGVALDAEVSVTFTKAAIPSTLAIRIEPEADLVTNWTVGETVLTVDPRSLLTASTQYNVFVDELTFVDGTRLPSNQYSIRFTTGGGTGGQPFALTDVRYWGYQIQGIDAPGAVDALAASKYDMLVIEPTRTDSELLDFDTRSMVQRLKSTTASDGIHRKLVIAYVDIGEAEDWRWYWRWSKEPQDIQISDDVAFPDDWPDFIVARDPDGWVGNYPVAFWDDRWKDIVIHGEQEGTTADRDYVSLVDELLVDGFDGIYLDWVEAFEDGRVIQAAKDEGRDAGAEMVAFIGEIRDAARMRNPSFLVIQQNAASLIDGRPNLVNVIDAIAQEGIWFDGPATDDWDLRDGYWTTESQLVAQYIDFLDRYRARGLPVFDCEYALEENAAEAYANANGRGYVPYVTRRSLGRLTTTPPAELSD